jgi:undecaprenyl phosphate-alpha-L-ara4N flippase subunit ArnE
MYILKNYPFSMSYPMVSLSYVFGMIAAILVFHEDVDLLKWLCVLLIMTGCFLISR